MTTEESPLLGDQLHPDADPARRALPTEDVYNRFSREQKRVILAIVSLTGLVPSASYILIRLVLRSNSFSTSVRRWLLCPVHTSNLH